MKPKLGERTSPSYQESLGSQTKVQGSKPKASKPVGEQTSQTQIATYYLRNEIDAILAKLSSS